MHSNCSGFLWLLCGRLIHLQNVNLLMGVWLKSSIKQIFRFVYLGHSVYLSGVFLNSPSLRRTPVDDWSRLSGMHAYCYRQQRISRKWKHLCRLCCHINREERVSSETEIWKSAGATFCRGVEGGVQRCVPSRCQCGGILKQHSLSSSSVILSLLLPHMPDLCLLCPSSSSLRILIHEVGSATKNTPISVSCCQL